MGSPGLRCPLLPVPQGTCSGSTDARSGEGWVLNLSVPRVPCGNSSVWLWQMMPPFGEGLLRTVPPLPMECLESLSFKALLVLIQSQWKYLHYISWLLEQALMEM